MLGRKAIKLHSFTVTPYSKAGEKWRWFAFARFFVAPLDILLYSFKAVIVWYCSSDMLECDEDHVNIISPCMIIKLHDYKTL